MKSLNFAIFMSLFFSVSVAVQAGTHAHIPMGADRALINISSGPVGSEDQDSIRLYEALKGASASSLFGSGTTKKIKWKEAMTIALTKNAKGRVDGTLMIYRWPGVRIDSSRRTVTIRWTGSAAESLYNKLNHPTGVLDYKSYDQRLIIFSSPSEFKLDYDDF